MSAVEQHTWEPFHDERLSPQQNKACEMLFNGWSRAEIEDELDISDKHLAQLFCKARKRGVWVDHATTRRRTGITTERLSELREMFKRNGCKWGVYRLIAERTGLTQINVYMRLYYFDRRQQGAKP